MNANLDPVTPPPATASADPSPPLETEAVMDALRTVIDPEVGLDVVTLGLIYDVAVDAGTLTLTYTLTTPGCPLAEYMRQAIIHSVEPLLGGRRLDARLVHEPAWTPERIEGGAW
jgi:metal-sulfur cluster biosynthetic enzyme